jgi:hypothetical protein
MSTYGTGSWLKSSAGFARVCAPNAGLVRTQPFENARRIRAPRGNVNHFHTPLFSFTRAMYSSLDEYQQSSVEPFLICWKFLVLTG